MVEIIPKKTQAAPHWMNIVFYVSLVILILSVSSIFFLNNSLKKSQETFDNIEKSLSAEKTEERIATQKDLLDYKKKIENFSLLIGNHLQTSKVFDFIQKNCHPKVWFSEFGLESNKKEISLVGTTDSFETLGQQIIIFTENDSVERVGLESTILKKEGKVEFTLSITLKPSVINEIK